MNDTEILIAALLAYRDSLPDGPIEMLVSIDNLIERVAFAPSLPPYIWRDPDGPGWVDAWNGWYATLAEAERDAAGSITSPTYLAYGEGIITAEEQERRYELTRRHAEDRVDS